MRELARKTAVVQTELQDSNLGIQPTCENMERHVGQLLRGTRFNPFNGSLTYVGEHYKVYAGQYAWTTVVVPERFSTDPASQVNKKHYQEMWDALRKAAAKRKKRVVLIKNPDHTDYAFGETNAVVSIKGTLFAGKFEEDGRRLVVTRPIVRQVDTLSRKVKRQRALLFPLMWRLPQSQKLLANNPFTR